MKKHNPRKNGGYRYITDVWVNKESEGNHFFLTVEAETIGETVFARDYITNRRAIEDLYESLGKLLDGK